MAELVSGREKQILAVIPADLSTAEWNITGARIFSLPALSADSGFVSFLNCWTAGLL
jgi:hypothetical protein